MTLRPAKAGIPRRGLVIGGTALAGLAVAAPAALVINLLRADTGVFPAGTRVGGLDIGGLKPAEAVARFDAIWAGYLANPVVFELDGRTWRPSAAEIGLQVDVRTPLRAAFLAGRSGGIVSRLAAGAEPAAGTFEPLVTFDAARLRAYVDGVAAGFDHPATNAELELRSDGSVQLRPSRAGRVIDVNGAVTGLAGITQPSQRPRTVPLQFREDLPEYRTDAAETAVDQLRRMISAPLTLLHDGAGWVIEPSEIQASVRIDQADGRFNPRIEFTRFNARFQEIEETLTAEPKQTVFKFDEARDRVLAFEPGNAGQRLDRTALERAIDEAVRQDGERAIEIPLILLNKEFDLTANPLGITDLLATGSSIYHGSPEYRNHNIKVGAEKLNGQILRPGEVFSFNERIGNFTLNEGWVEGSIIVADKTERGIGGGICQVSTTLFRAVINAGLPIEERWPHLYRVRYYEMGDFPIGIDATIFKPGPDVQFRNDYAVPIMLRTRVDPVLSTLDIEIWGAREGRKVEVVDNKLWAWTDPPPDEGIVNDEEAPDFEDQVEWAKQGVQASFTRVITRAGAEPVRSTFRSSYTAWPNRFVVGIDVAKARFPRAYNKWFDENPEKAAAWGVGRVRGLPADPDAPAG